jgi:pantothenate kinase-related protein Tda10
MADRPGKPIHLDISDLPMKRGIITNRNKFILGPSGSGKSFLPIHGETILRARGACAVGGYR